jgi:hypothetical protein
MPKSVLNGIFLMVEILVEIIAFKFKFFEDTLSITMDLGKLRDTCKPV